MSEALEEQKGSLEGDRGPGCLVAAGWKVGGQPPSRAGRRWTTRNGRAAARLTIGLAVFALGSCATARQGAGGADAQDSAAAQAAEPPRHVERLTHELNGIPGAGVIMVYESPGEVDVEYRLLAQRVRWTARREGDELRLFGFGWADYRNRCGEAAGAGSGGTSRRTMSCMAPFHYFFPEVHPGGGVCYANIDFVDAVCSGDGEVHETLNELFRLGGELTRHATTALEESFAAYRMPLHRAFSLLRRLPKPAEGVSMEP